MKLLWQHDKRSIQIRKFDALTATGIDLIPVFRAEGLSKRPNDQPLLSNSRIWRKKRRAILINLLFHSRWQSTTWMPFPAAFVDEKRAMSWNKSICQHIQLRNGDIFNTSLQLRISIWMCRFKDFRFRISVVFVDNWIRCYRLIIHNEHSSLHTFQFESIKMLITSVITVVQISFHFSNPFLIIIIFHRIWSHCYTPVRCLKICETSFINFLFSLPFSLYLSLSLFLSPFSSLLSSFPLLSHYLSLSPFLSISPACSILRLNRHHRHRQPSLVIVIGIETGNKTSKRISINLVR